MTIAEVIGTYPAQIWKAGKVLTETTRRLANEAPVGVAYNGRSQAVMMVTPADLEDFAVGFTLTEGFARLGDIAAIEPRETVHGVLLDIRLLAGAQAPRRQHRARAIEGRSGCGLCGLQQLAEANRHLPEVGEGLAVRHEAIQVALDALELEQTLGRITRAMHAAAWVTREGKILCVREDVGRHNALDKLIGAAAREGLSTVDAFIVVTSRCSFEMVEKVAMAGVQMIVAISAPTALAIDKARATGMTLVAIARSDGHMVFSGAHRLVSDVCKVDA